MIALEPGIRRPYVLEGYRDRENPPVFYFRSLSARDNLKPARIRDELIEAGQVRTEEQLAKLVEGIGCGLVGWDNVGREFELNELSDICTINEMYELLNCVVFEGLLDYEDKKK